MPYSAKTELKKYAQRYNRTIIGKGSMSVVSEAYLDDHVLKHTYCKASPKFLEQPKTVTKGAVYFVSADYRGCEYIRTREGKLLVNSFQLPKLHKCRKTALNKEAAIQYDFWKQFLNAQRYNVYKDINSYRHLAIQVMDDIYLEDSEFKEDLRNLIYSLESDDRIDCKFSGNVMMDDEGNLVITDPVFNVSIFNLVTGR